MHWADVFADRLLEKRKRHVLATGITPSGPIHIGNMREILTTDAIYRALVEKGGEADFIYIADDFDPLRKVYPYLPCDYEQYVGMPISEIPCPCGGHKSYADHYLSSFLDSLKAIGVHPKVYRAAEMYKKGYYNESIQIALDNTSRIREIIERISKRKLPKNWLPFNILCEKCGRMNTTTPLLYEYPIIEYKCECGYTGEVDIRKGGVGKLPWRVDWPARWRFLEITFEPCGKDLATVGGARDTGREIVEKIFNYPHPALMVYEFILLKGKGAMHSSKGTALSAEEMLHMTPPEVLRFLLMNNQPSKHITFDSGLGLLNLVDEYDKVERVYFGREEKTRGMKDLERVYELSQPYEISREMPFQLPYRHLVTLAQIGGTWDGVKKILIRTNQIPKELDSKNEERLKQRLENVHYWLEHFAPDDIKFKVQDVLPDITLTAGQKDFLSMLSNMMESIRWDGEAIHNTIYDAAEKVNMSVKDAFKTIYQVILGQDKGPRAGYFLSNLEKNFVLDRLREAVK